MEPESLMPDWKNPDDYTFCETLSREQWAWEFLRRNPDYRHEWAEFIATWRALEADYGKAPNRDFQRWKADPRAYVLEDEIDCDSDSCKVDDNKVMIECHLGARWGFYKFPLDPATDTPEIGEQLLWREVLRGAREVTVDEAAWLAQEGHIALGFDLDLPLREQLEVAKRHLQALQHRFRRSGGVMRTIRSETGRLVLMLRLLDGSESGAGDEALASQLPDCGDDCREILAEAVRLRDGGYRQLLLLPR